MIQEQTYKVNQSAIKDFYAPYRGGEACPKRWQKINLEGVRTAPSDAMLQGLVFEHELLGATAKEDEIPHLPLLKNGGISKVEKDIRALASYIKDLIFPHYGIDILETQVKMETKTAKGTADAIIQIKARRALMDVKFTNFKNDEYNIWNFGRDKMTWGQLKNFNDAKLQSTHYVTMSEEIYGEYLPFYFFIVGKSGWFKVQQFVLTPSGLDEYKKKIIQFNDDKSEWEKQGYPVNPSFNICKNCPFEDCESRVIIPEIETFSI